MNNTVSTLNFKFFVKVIILLSLVFVSSFEITSAGFKDWFNAGWATNPYWQSGYDLESWIDKSKEWLNNIEKDKKLSEYSQDIVAYLLTFVSVIAVIYLIYWGFVMMLSAWNEEKVKKTKWIITYVVLWILVMWISYSLVLWFFSVFDRS